jgi:hypothetical protein
MRELAVLVLALAACNNVTKDNCQSITCSGNGNQYQECTSAAGDITFRLAGGSCKCSALSATSCNTCTSEISTYCGNGDGGIPLDSGAGSCLATFSGGVSASDSTCSLSIESDSTSWTASLGSTTVGGDAWSGIFFENTGAAAVGTFNQNMSVRASTTLGGTGTSASSWSAVFDNGTAIGSAVLMVNDLGSGAMVSGSTVYADPHGTFIGTLVDQTANKAADVTLQITF